MQRTRLVKKQKPSALPHDSDDERFRSRIKTCTVGKSVSSESLSLNLKLLRQRELCPSIHLERTVSHQLSRLEVGSQWQLNSLVSCVDIDEAESRLLLFGCASGNVNVMNLDNSSISNIVTTSKMVSHCLFQPSASHTFLSVGTDNRVAVWDIVKATSSNSFSSDSRILNVGWNSSGEVFPAIAAANFTPHVPIYDVRVGDTGRFVSVPWKATSVCWLPTDGSWMLMIGGANGDIGLWDVRSARKQLAVLCGSRGTYKSTHACPVGAMKAVGNRLVTYSTDNRLQVFDATSLALESVLRTWSTTYKAIPNDPSTPFAATCISNELIVALPSSTDVHLTNLSKAGEATSVSLAGHVQAVRACVFRPHHYELFSAGGDKRLIKWSSSLCRPHSDEKSLRKRAEAMRDNWSDSE